MMHESLCFEEFYERDRRERAPHVQNGTRIEFRDSREDLHEGVASGAQVIPQVELPDRSGGRVVDRSSVTGRG
jgi:hypothetical protein